MSFTDLRESVKNGTLGNFVINLVQRPDLKDDIAKKRLKSIQESIIKYLKMLEENKCTEAEKILYKKLDPDNNLLIYFPDEPYYKIDGIVSKRPSKKTDSYTYAIHDERIVYKNLKYSKPCTYTLHWIKFNGEHISNDAQLQSELKVYESPTLGYISKGVETIDNSRDKREFIKDFEWIDGLLRAQVINGGKKLSNPDNEKLWS